MISFKFQKLTTATLFIYMAFFSSCLTSKKMDNFISEQYNNEVPKVNKRKQVENITFASSLPAAPGNISTTAPHTKVSPFIVYWVIDSRHTSTLNSGIAATNFANAVNTVAHKGLDKKLNGQKLELTMEQAPATFALVDKTHAVWLVLYAIHWDKIYIEPDTKDLVVSYKFYKDDNSVKIGKIIVKNKENNKNLRFFQSWKSAISEHLADYDNNVTAMSNQFVDELVKEL